MSVIVLSGEEFGHLASYLCVQCGWDEYTADACLSSAVHTNSRAYAERYKEPVGWRPTVAEVAVQRGLVRGQVSPLQALRLLSKLEVNAQPMTMAPGEVDNLMLLFEAIADNFIHAPGSAAANFGRVLRRARLFGNRLLMDPRLYSMVRRGLSRTMLKITRSFPDAATKLAPTY